MTLTFDLQVIRTLLIKHNLKISCAESCTGGLLASYLTDVSGASQYLDVSLVTYANHAKMKFVNVDPAVIEQYGVVSEQVAQQMCEGLLQYSDVGLATTGILGPEGGTEQNPVGTVCIGVCLKGKTKVITYRSIKASTDSRTEIKKDIAKKAINLLAEFLNENLK